LALVAYNDADILSRDLQESFPQFQNRGHRSAPRAAVFGIKILTMGPANLERVLYSGVYELYGDCILTMTDLLVRLPPCGLLR
jgi:hypothetical protein